MELAERMKRLRLAAGLTQEALASQLNRPGAWVSRREVGETAFKPDDIADWAEVCGFDVHTLFVPSGVPATELLDALTTLDATQANVLARAAMALPKMTPEGRDLVLAQLELVAERAERG
ncbi:MAG: helix-turn-helix transcriptional regulator [Alphaproteobacteria bacterium]|nr:helix-turn-helix transcriptional regulator [Alphaproteobacteria bacterium]